MPSPRQEDTTDGSANGPLVSVVVPTRNNSTCLTYCLQSIRGQDYDNIEVVVVDNHSTDATVAIARQYADQVLSRGPERSSQRNFGASQAKGAFLMMVDSDMELSSRVVSECVACAMTRPSIGGVVIPETSHGYGFWARCKALEKNLYQGVHWMEAARFFPIGVFRQVGGYDEELVGGEDWDLSQRVAEVSLLSRIEEFIYHNEGTLTLRGTMRKKAYYARKLASYRSKAPNVTAARKQLRVRGRSRLFFAKRRQLLADPVTGAGLVVMKAAEFLAMVVAVVSMKLGKGSVDSEIYSDGR